MEIDRPIGHEADARRLFSAYVDPFYAEKTICVHCTVHEPDTGERYDRDPRATARNAEEYLKSTGIGDTAFFGP